MLFLALKTTWQNFSAAKLRTFLTVLGIIIGITAVVIVMSVGRSAQELLLDQVRAVGSNLIVVLPGAAADDGPPAIAFGIVTTTLINEDVEQLRIKSNFPHILYASGYVTTNKIVRHRSTTKSYEIQGVSADAVNIERMSIAEGQFISAADEGQNARVAVIGAEVAKELFDKQNPIGKNIKIDKTNYRVIGILKKRGTSFFGDFDKTIYVPLTTAQKSLLGIDYLSFARMRIDDERNITATEAEIRKLLKTRHGIPQDEEGDFSVRNLASALNFLGNITNVVRYFLITVAGIALVVGGIGVMNMMLITLNRRVREIGLRKSLGARSLDIALQFITESLIIALVGGIIGSILGFSLIELVAVIATANDLAWQTNHAPSIYLTACGIASVIGIIFGIYPAFKAQRVSPMEALRYE